MAKSLLLAALAAASAATVSSAQSLDNSYVVQLKPQADAAAFGAKLARFVERENAREGSTVHAQVERGFNINDEFKACASSSLLATPNSCLTRRAA